MVLESAFSFLGRGRAIAHPKLGQDDQRRAAYVADPSPPTGRASRGDGGDHCLLRLVGRWPQRCAQPSPMEIGTVIAGHYAYDCSLDVQDLQTRLQGTPGLRLCCQWGLLPPAGRRDPGRGGRERLWQECDYVEPGAAFAAAASIESGQVLLKGTDLLQCTNASCERCAAVAIGMIFQDPMTSLNPFINIGTQMAEPLIYHRGLSKEGSPSPQCRSLGYGRHSRW